MSKSKILYIFTRTPLHVGAGSSVGAIDQPIIRERHTGFPVIPGSSIKGVLRDTARRDDSVNSDVDRIFGKQDDSGKVSLGEAKLLAFPVRSAKGSFAFATCPLALERFKREYGGIDTLAVPEEPEDMACLAGATVTITRGGKTGVVLEEYCFSRAAGDAGKFPPDWEIALLKLLDDPVWQAGKGRFVLLSNGDFAHFVKNACEVSQHVAIDPQKGTAKAGALFNLEAVPAETLFFAPLTPLSRANGELDKLAEMFSRKPLLQFGGDGTTGLGFCTVKLSQGEQP
ncbi:MAG TPA: type III-B CRISPR module RAMP protein Cmr4 [Verrucomicrobiae bacterium]|nr:type III-B CRISPR module RAMP protein Cmr4 [Verrucomicrobiae bacterium]